MKITRVLACVSILLTAPFLSQLRAASAPPDDLTELRKELTATNLAIKEARQDVQMDRSAKNRERKNGSTETRKEARENLNPAKARHLQDLLDRKVELERKIEKLLRTAGEPAPKKDK